MISGRICTCGVLVAASGGRHGAKDDDRFTTGMSVAMMYIASGGGAEQLYSLSLGSRAGIAFQRCLPQSPNTAAPACNGEGTKPDRLTIAWNPESWATSFTTLQVASSFGLFALGWA